MSRIWNLRIPSSRRIIKYLEEFENLKELNDSGMLREYAETGDFRQRDNRLIIVFTASCKFPSSWSSLFSDREFSATLM